MSTNFPDVCFVPTVSALDVAAPETSAFEPIPDNPPDGCGFDAYKYASQNEGHTLVTEELCTWIMANLAD